MKSILIVATLIATLLTFYSALRFKSEAIETDITARVTEEISVADVSVDVDGRHVTLSGVVRDTTEEAALLAAADATRGALGPVDGLTVQAASGFVAATKSEAGISLNGTIPDEATRAALLDAAGAATDGDVTDELVVSGALGSWHDEASFGLGQLAAMSSGSMTAGSDALVLSGVAIGDPSAITSALDARGSWKALVAAPDISAQLAADIQTLETELTEAQARVAGLESEVASKSALLVDRDGTIDRLNATITALRTDFGTDRDVLQAQIDTERSRVGDLSVELERLRAGLSDGAATSSDLTADLASTRALLADRDGTIDRLNGELAELRASSASERDGLQAELAAASNLVADRDGTIDQLNARISGLEADLGSLNNDLEGLQATLAERDTTVEGLTGDLEAQAALAAEREDSIQALTTELEGLRSGLSAEEAAANTLNAEIAALRSDMEAAQESYETDFAAQNALIAERDSTIEALTADLADRDSTLAELNAQLESLRDGLSAEEAELANLRAELADRDSTVEALTADLETQAGEVTDRDATIAELNAQLESLRDGLSAEEAELANLRAELADRDSMIENLNGEVETQAGLVAERDTTIAELTSDLESARTAQSSEAATLAALRSELADRDSTIETLQAELAASPSDAPRPETLVAVDQCAARAETVIEGTQINFVTGSANISSDSEALLERLTGIALACINENVVLEIGGHTDDRGDEDRNLALSEERAAAVLAFMAERGVPETGLVATGFGESQPISDNETSEGRAANRRISFGWEAR